MKILLAQSMVYIPSWGGANKLNRLLLEQLSDRGHECVAIAPATGVHGVISRAEFLRQLDERGIPIDLTLPNIDVFYYRGVRVKAVAESRFLAHVITREIDEFRPDRILVAAEDPGQILLAAALKTGARPIIVLVRTPFTLPFGPAAAMKSERGRGLFRQADGIVVVSRYLQDYLHRWAGLSSEELPICLNGSPPPPKASGRSDFVTMVNPCEYKGISIFLEMAATFTDSVFAAVPTWGTTTHDRERLQGASNVRLLPPSDDIDSILDQTRILLVPSLIPEGKPNIIAEAMLRGIPVLAGDVGGTREAMHGLDYLLPVTPIEHFGLKYDERLLPQATVPEQPIGEWQQALGELISDPMRYGFLSAASRRAALQADATQTIDQFEHYLCRH